MPDTRTESGIRVFDDHRDNLTVDVENALLRDRAAQLRSEDSSAAMLWNVFRSLERIDARVWVPRLLLHALDARGTESTRGTALASPHNLAHLSMAWWQRFDVPPSRNEWLRDAALNASLHLEHYPARYLREKKDEIRRRLEMDLPLEDPVEVHLCLETPEWLLGLLGVYRDNLRLNTRYDAQRDDVARLLDAGSHTASARGKRFIGVVVYNDGRTYNSETVNLVERYRNHPEHLRAQLPHRTDTDVLHDAAALLGVLRWRDVGTLLLDAKDEERIGLFDRAVLDEIVKYLARKDVGFNFFRRLK